MLSTIEKVQTVGSEAVIELHSIVQICNDLINAIENCKEQNLAREVGIFARTMPKFKAFADESRQMVEIARKVCTLEISKKEAIESLSKIVEELENTQKNFM